MKAWVFEEVGLPPNKKEIELIKDDSKVIVDLLSSSINHRDLWITKGMYPGLKSNVALGSDGFGTFDGREYIINPGLNWGTNESFQSESYTILGMPDHGCFAERVVVDRNQLYLKPGHLTSLEAAALPLAGVTAYRALVTKTLPKSGERVLISGIGGGVALFAMQFALALNCEVYVTSSSKEKLKRATELGAKKGYLYTNPDWTKELINDIGGVDIVIDSAGGDGFNDLIKICNPGARVSFYGGSKGKINGLNPQTIFWKQISIFGSTMGSDLDFKNMVDFVNQYRIKPVIDQVIDFESLLDGFEIVEAGKQFGKIVIKHQ